MRALEATDLKLRYIIYDMETEQTTGTHNVCFAVAQTVCEFCVHEQLTADSKCVSCGTRCDDCSAMTKDGEFERDPCETCGKRQNIFDEGINTLKTFGRWLFSTQHSNFTAIAHNAGNYDAVLLLHYLIYDNDKTSIIPE